MRPTACLPFAALAIPCALLFGLTLVAAKAHAATLVYAPEFTSRDEAGIGLRLTFGSASELFNFDVPHDTGRLLADPSATPPVPSLSLERWGQGFTTVELPFVVGGVPGLLVVESSFEALLGDNLDTYPASSSAPVEELVSTVTGRLELLGDSVRIEQAFVRRSGELRYTAAVSNDPIETFYGSPLIVTFQQTGTVAGIQYQFFLNHKTNSSPELPNTAWRPIPEPRTALLMGLGLLGLAGGRSGPRGVRL